MKHFIRTLAMILALTLMPALGAGMGRAAAEEENTLVVGTITAPAGEFYLPLWGNNTSDIDVRRLLHGYSTIIGEGTEHRSANPLAVADMTVAETRTGKVYTFRLQPGLFFSDGTEITAKNYILTLLMTYHPMLEEAGAAVEPVREIVGCQDYQRKSRKEFAGVRLLDKHTFSIALHRKELPDYNELRYVDLFPTPLQPVIPGIDIVDDGRGAYLTEDLTAALLKETLRGEKGYCSHPGVVSGPYMLESYDEATGEARFKRNEYYAGVKPAIECIKLVPLSNDEAVQALTSGRVHLVNKLLSKSVLEQLAGAQGLNAQRYPREGLAYIAFCHETEAAQSLPVRKAVAYSLDREALVREFYGENGVVVNGYYGIGQWMAVHQSKLESEGPEGYAFNPAAAANMVRRAGYTRRRPLKMTLLIAEKNAVAEAVAAQLAAAFENMGAELTVERQPWPEVLRRYYRQSPRDCDMIFMASNFAPYFEPMQQFFGEKGYRGLLNPLNMKNDALAESAERMQAVPPEADRQYFLQWQRFQREFMRALPMAPLYSNYYTDVFTDRLTGYDITAHISWADAVLNASFSAK